MKSGPEVCFSPCADLIKNDAGNATMLIGTNECMLPGDVSWAKSVTLASTEGPRKRFNSQYRRSPRSTNFWELFPADANGIIGPAEETTMHEALNPENFNERPFPT